MEKMWGGRFTKQTNTHVEEFTSSIPFDYKLAYEDIAGSIAHARMLGKCGILTAEEAARIIDGLEEIRREIQGGKFTFSVALEDIHMNIEKALTEKIGPIGGKLHTARSRNDQVALDTHLYVKKAIREIAERITELEETLLSLAQENLGVILPGYTHLQRAQPVLLSHHLMAYFQMFARDMARLQNCYQHTDFMPLGAGALAGTSFPIQPQLVAQELDFANLYANSMDAVSDRDYLLEFLSAAAIIMMHLSRLSEEIILWSSSEFSFIELDDAFCTGSSIMPQKKNPDVAELVRGKTGRVYGNLVALLTVMKGLPLAYNKDMQEDKEPLFDTVETLKSSVLAFTGMLRTLKINKEVMALAVTKDFSNATDLADYLVRKGLPFRQAHAVVGAMVQSCIQNGKFLTDLSLEEFQAFSPLFTEEVLNVVKPENVVNARISPGGTARANVEQAIAKGRELLQQWKSK